MILSNELRIGNYVLGKEFNSSEIKPIEVCVIWPSGDNHFYLNPTILDGCIDLWDELIDPILLTPEILEKCGFKSYGASDTSYFVVAKEIDFFVINIFDGVFYYAPQVDFKESQAIKYLHQLQNLYFALTGEELEVNL